MCNCENEKCKQFVPDVFRYEGTYHMCHMCSIARVKITKSPQRMQGQTPRIRPVIPAVITVRGTDLVLNAEQSIYWENLSAVDQIIRAHTERWVGRGNTRTLRRLATARSMLNGLISSLNSISEPEQMILHLHAALRGKTGAEVCIVTNVVFKMLLHSSF